MKPRNSKKMKIDPWSQSLSYFFAIVSRFLLSTSEILAIIERTYLINVFHELFNCLWLFFSLPKGNAFLQREEGQVYIPLFTSLRLHGITDRKLSSNLFLLYEILQRPRISDKFDQNEKKILGSIRYEARSRLFMAVARLAMTSLPTEEIGHHIKYA